MNTLIHIVVWVLILTVILICLIIRHRRQTRLSDPMDYYDRLADREIRRGLEEDENERMLQEHFAWIAEMDAKEAKRAYEKMVKEDEEKAEASGLLDLQITS